MRLLTLLLLIMAGVTEQSQAQTPLNAKLEFEVATVKPASPDATSSGTDSDPGLLRIQNQPLRALMRVAYDVNEVQVTGGPKWVESARFDIEGRANGPAGDPQLKLMLQSLLAERFQLKFHRETRTVNGYALVAAKGGVKMEAAEGAGSSSQGRRGLIEGKGYRMKQFAERLSRLLQAPVEDATGTTGGYNFTLKWAAETLSANPPADADGPTIFTALQEQLGLRLESRKVSMEMLVIDTVEKPTEN